MSYTGTGLKGDIVDIAEFGKLYEQYMEQKRNEMKKLYNRVLPSGELIFNRYEKAGYLDCGEGTSVYDTSVVMGDVKIGKNTWVGAGVTVSNNVSICDDCMIGAGAVVIKDIDEPGTYVGIPAKRVFMREKNIKINY